eukprot:2083319-Prymnesium_polylepis.1
MDESLGNFRVSRKTRNTVTGLGLAKFRNLPGSFTILKLLKIRCGRDLWRYSEYSDYSDYSGFQ